MADQPPAMQAAAPSEYPITLDFDGGLDVQNWRPLVNWLLAIPHWIILYFLAIASVVLGIVSFFTVLFTLRNPFVGFQSMFLRYEWRVTSYTYWMRNEYPPFDFDTVMADNGLYPAMVSVDDPGDMNRWLPLVKWFLAIPHYIVLTFLGVAVWFVLLASFFMVLFTGKWSVGMRDFVVGVMRWGTRVYGYVFLITDPYPPFRLQP